MGESEQDFWDKDGIDPDKIRANLEIMKSGSKAIYQASAKLQGQKDIGNNCTETIEWMANPLNQPAAYPTWFMAAYPDVVKWCSKLSNDQLILILGEPSTDFIGVDNHFESSILRKIVDAYKKIDALECRKK